MLLPISNATRLPASLLATAAAAASAGSATLRVTATFLGSLHEERLASRSRKQVLPIEFSEFIFRGRWSVKPKGGLGFSF